MATPSHPKRFLPADVAAARLGVPANYLRQLIRDGRIPTLRAGRRVLVDLPATEAALADLAANAQREGGGA
ncbi:MAG: excisionase family DNA-binding protein [Phycisphaeraceae bacterium]|nr:excisionase family DNA-binding protein [Phycisphaeraceae bacterium]